MIAPAVALLAITGIGAVTIYLRWRRKSSPATQTLSIPFVSIEPEVNSIPNFLYTRLDRLPEEYRLAAAEQFLDHIKRHMEPGVKYIVDLGCMPDVTGTYPRVTKSYRIAASNTLRITEFLASVRRSYPGALLYFDEDRHYLLTNDAIAMRMDSADIRSAAG